MICLLLLYQNTIYWVNYQQQKFTVFLALRLEDHDVHTWRAPRCCTAPRWREEAGMGGGVLYSQHTPSLPLLLPRGPRQARSMFPVCMTQCPCDCFCHRKANKCSAHRSSSYSFSAKPSTQSSKKCGQLYRCNVLRQRHRGLVLSLDRLFLWKDQNLSSLSLVTSFLPSCY